MFMGFCHIAVWISIGYKGFTLTNRQIILGNLTELKNTKQKVTEHWVPVIWKINSLYNSLSEGAAMATVAKETFINKISS